MTRTTRNRATRILPVVVLLGVMLLLAGCVGAIGTASSSVKAWPASASGRPAFYYFGSGS